jgi:hypothetical protein
MKKPNRAKKFDMFNASGYIYMVVCRDLTRYIQDVYDYSIIIIIVRSFDTL